MTQLPLYRLAPVWPERFQLIRMLLALACLLLIIDPAQAQLGSLLSGNGSDAGGGTLVDKNTMHDNARHAFEVAVKEEIVSVLNQYSQADKSRLEEVGRQALADFTTKLDSELTQLEGDGALTLSEVTKALASLREKQLNQVKGAITARAQGYPPPPVSNDYDSRWAYHGAMARYTLLVRNSTGEWLWLFGWAILGLVVAWVISRLLRLGGEWLDGRGMLVTADMVKTINFPLYIIGILASLYIAMDYRVWIPVSTDEFIDQGFWILLLLASFYLCWNLARALADMCSHFTLMVQKRPLPPHAIAVLRRVIRLIVGVIFLLLAANLILDSNIGSLIAGFGIIGLALAFAFRSMLQNVVASFTLFSDRPMKVGDMLIHNGTWGTVEDIGFRSTRFRSFDGHLINIPNDVLVREAIDNVSARPFIRRRCRLGLMLDNSPAKVQEAIQIIKDILEERKDQQGGQPYRVMFVDYGSYDIQLLIQYYFAPPDYWGAKEFDSEVNLEILRRFDEASIRLAVPTGVSVLETDEERIAQLELRGKMRAVGHD